jgi:nucleoside-diphosphate-sugar epimerase
VRILTCKLYLSFETKVDHVGKFIVTGSAGYIGRYVVMQLAAQGHEVTAILRDSSSVTFPAEVAVIESDLWQLELEKYELLLKESTLIHLAWQDGFVHTSDAHMGHLSEHYRFVRSCIELGVTKVVGLGTMHELGPQTGLVSEDALPNPQNQYGIAKNAFRLSLKELCNRLEIELLWLRCFYILGDDSRNHSVFTKMLQLEASGEKKMPLTLGATKFDFIQVDELGRLIAQVSGIDGLTGVLNLGSGTAMSLRERLELFHQEHQLRIELDFGAFPERHGIGEGCWPDVSKLIKFTSS